MSDLKWDDNKNSSINYYLCNYKFSILRAAKLQLVSNVRKWYSWIWQVDHADAGLDDIVTQTYDQGVRSLSWELVGVGCQRLIEVVQVARANSCQQKNLSMQPTKPNSSVTIQQSNFNQKHKV